MIFLGISKGDYNQDVIDFDEMFGITYPSVSGFDGGGNQIHQTYQVQSTPTVLIILPNRYIANQGIWPPTQENITSAVIQAGGMPVGLDELKGPSSEVIQLKTYPNPAVNDLNISFDIASAGNYSIELVSPAGNRILRTASVFQPEGSHLEKVPVGHLAKGIYYLRLIKDGKVLETSKILLQ